MTESQKERPSIWVRATVNLQELRRGQMTEADPQSQWIRDNLRSGHLVRVAPPKE